MLSIERLQVMGSCGGTEKLTSVLGWISRGASSPLQAPMGSEKCSLGLSPDKLHLD